MRVLFIEDSASLRNSLSIGLEKLGYSVDVAETGTDGLSMALLGSYDIIILDMMLPELDGLALLRALRKRNLETRVLILSARSESEDKVEGILAGADDYLTKPFSFDELCARLVCLMRRGVANYASDEITISDFRLNLQTKTFNYLSHNIALTPNEYKIVECMFLNRDKVVTSEKLSEFIAGSFDHISKNAIEAHLSSARKKVREFGATLPIKSKRGFGYMVTGPDEINS
ncbi:response regulator transcription factor [Alteromonas sp. D210916BOD_24]|uniref:response regulator transcription factor n=1 Tax=Alteromonas sp. D210916BOD_24 TaxID=3157618 RepID=UPI00399C72BA